MVGGEGEDPVEVVAPGVDAVEGVAVGLVHVDGVLAEQLEGHVAQVEAVGPVGLDAVVLDPFAVLVEAAPQDDVLHAGAGALDLQVAQLVVAHDVRVGRVVAGDRHQVDDLAAADDQRVLHDAAVVAPGAGRRPGRLLAVGAGQHVHVGAPRLHRVDRRLDVAVGALRQQRPVERLDLRVGHGVDALGAVGLAHDEVGRGRVVGPVGRGSALTRWEDRLPLLVGCRGPRRPHQQQCRRCHDPEQPATSAHAGAPVHRCADQGRGLGPSCRMLTQAGTRSRGRSAGQPSCLPSQWWAYGPLVKGSTSRQPRSA